MIEMIISYKEKAGRVIPSAFFVLAFIPGVSITILTSCFYGPFPGHAL
jgi:hypothetical protein